MEGYIKITAAPAADGVSIGADTHLERVCFEDKVFLLNTLAGALNMSDEDLFKAVMLRKLVCKNVQSAKVDLA